MKSFNTLIIIITLSLSIVNAQKTAYISGKINNRDGRKVVLNVENHFGTEDKHAITKVKLDKNGFFSTQIKLNYDSINQVSLYHKNEMTYLTVLPGDSIYFEVDCQNFDESLVYSGRGAEKLNFYAKYFLSFQDTTQRVIWDMNPHKYLKYRKQLLRNELAFLGQFKNLSEEYIRYIKSKFKKDFYSNIHSFVTFNHRANYDSMIFAGNLPQYKKILEQPELSNYKNSYQDFYHITGVINYKYHEFKFNNGFDKNNPDSVHHIVRKIQLAKKVLPSYLFEFYLTGITVEMTESSYTYRYLKPIVNFIQEQVQDKDFQSLIRSRISKYDTPKKQKKAKNTHIDTQMYTLEEIINKHRGKVLYIDFWASWCAPCIEEIKNSEKLKKAFKKEIKKGKITFIYLSTDKREDIWKKAVLDLNIKGLNYRAMIKDYTQIQKKYNFNTIPHYMIVDRNGVLINSNAPRPSSPEIVDILKKYLK